MDISEAYNGKTQKDLVMIKGSGFIPKTKVELESLSSDRLLARIYDMVIIIERHKDRFQLVLLEYNETLELVHLAGEALLFAEDNYAEAHEIAILVTGYREARKEHEKSKKLSNEMVLEAFAINEEVNSLKDAALELDLNLEDGYLDGLLSSITQYKVK